MATQKRRVIYLSDEQWEEAKTQAKKLGISISNNIADLIANEKRAMEPVGQPLLPDAGPRVVHFTPVPKPSRK